VWNWWNNRICVREIKNTFGMFNQYDSAGNKNPNKKCVEKLFADLECDMGAILKKVESSLELDKDRTGTQASLKLLESEVHTIYKFIALAGFRNGPFGLSHDSEDAYSTDTSQRGYREDWVKTLEFLLETPHKDLAEMDELLQAEMLRPTLARYKQLSIMKLFFWTTSMGGEFLLSNLLTGIEGYKYLEEDMSSQNIGLPAHVFLPMSPEVLLVLCSDTLCRQSILKDAPHGTTAPYDRPAKGRLGKTNGPKKYQPVVSNWKTIYPITPISANDLYTINNLILALGDVTVYKSRSELEKTIDNMASFEQRYIAWRKAIQYFSGDVKNEEQTSISEHSYALLRVLQTCHRQAIRCCKEEMRGELMNQSEIIEKHLYHGLVRHPSHHLLPVLCRSSAYYMGTEKSRPENNLK
jgi:hypothetical protein